MGKFISLKYDFSFKHLFLYEKVRRHFISDVLDIPLDEIRSVRLANTFLWKQYLKQKQGILDVLMELNDNSKINIELQIRFFTHWAKRSLFYLAKMYTEDFLVGERYHKLRKCICINILNYNMDDLPEYHKTYRLRDAAGHEFSDMFEIHIIELNKKLSGNHRIDDWIRLFLADTEEELNMLKTKTKNPGVLEAIRQSKIMNLNKRLRAMYDAYAIEQSDKASIEDYIRSESIRQGLKQGLKQGLEQGLALGRNEGEDRLNRLILSLITDKRNEDIEKAAKDKKYREQLYQEYGI